MIRNQLSSLINQISPKSLSESLDSRACVALILRGETLETLELAFIQRAFSVTDRWSGQLAFPGGKSEAQDVSDVATAIRETKEEVGIFLGEEHLIGRIDDIQARRAGSMLNFYIRPFVFYYPESNYSIVLDASEVADFFWVPLKDILDPCKQTTYRFELSTEPEMPAVFLDRDLPLWGLTYMMTLNLIQRLGLG